MEIESVKRVKINLNMAPLIDVVFLLLIFFMLSYHFVAEPGIKITLPEAITAKSQLEEDVVIYITKDNELYLNEEYVTLERLLSSLKTKIDKSRKKAVIIKADEKVDLGFAVKVMDIARQAEAEGLVISTQITQMKEDAKR